MITNEIISNALVAPTRKVQAKVELYSGSTLAQTFTYDGAIQEINIDRVGENGKFFGFGICQKLTLKLRDKDRQINIVKDDKLKVYFGLLNEYPDILPFFFVTEVKRDELTNALTITAYDAINNTANHTVAELGLSGSYSFRDFVVAIKNTLSMGGVYMRNISPEMYAIDYPQGANFDGTETIRAALDAVAATIGAIYYMNNKGIVFLRIAETAVYTVDKANYFKLESAEGKYLSYVVSATELGDNISAATGYEGGATQYVRDNPFWVLREDAATLIQKTATSIANRVITPFNLQWRGNFLLELGDMFSIVTKDNEIFSTYLLNDTITYKGGYSQKTNWEYKEDKGESASNPATLGEVLNQTFAKVDKVNKQVEIVASEAAANAEKIASLQINTNGISASVSKLEKATTEAIGAVNDNVADLTNRVNAAVTAEDVRLEIQTELANGTTKVITSTGFTFDDEGLTVSKSNSQMKTTITENGMEVFRDNTAVLTANNIGVDAVNLHATTYLIIGNNSRFEDYGNKRTGCFWIGG